MTTRLPENIPDFLKAELREIRPGLPSDLSPAQRYTELGCDSLDLAQLVARIEQRYALQVPDADLEQFLSLDDTLHYLMTRLAE